MSILSPILGPTWLHFRARNGPKSNQNSISKGIKKLIEFYIDFGTILAPFWRRLGRQNGAKIAPRRAQEGPGGRKTRRFFPASLGRRSGAALGPARGGSGAAPGRSGAALGSIFDRFFIDFS